MATYRLRQGRIVPALLAGAGLGAALVAGAASVQFSMTGGPAPFALTLPIFVVAFVVWAVGLALIGGPTWIISETLGWRTAAHAVSAGGLVTLMSTVLLFGGMSNDVTESTVNGRVLIVDGARTLAGWGDLLGAAGLLAIPGALVAGLIWRIAYVREERDVAHA